MAEVVSFKKAADKEKESAIEVLEEMLKRAKAGDIQAVTIGVVRSAGTTGYSWSAGHAPSMLGAASMLVYALQQSMDMEFEDDAPSTS